ncbi:hypothetical protein BJ912DRAFT_640552 [Pholiota molesta]|nr:hypothetical protein BJ912DRAFT_640552 [Pholiota molesta]
MPYFLPHVYPNPRTMRSHTTSTSTSPPQGPGPTHTPPAAAPLPVFHAPSPKYAITSAAFNATRKLPFLRTPPVSAWSASQTYASPSPGANATRPTSGSPSPAAGLHPRATRKARPTTTLSLAHVSASAFRAGPATMTENTQPAAPVEDADAPQAQARERGDDAVGALSAVQVQADLAVAVDAHAPARPIEVRVETTRVVVEDAPSAPAVHPEQGPVERVERKKSRKSLRALDVAPAKPQINIIPFPTSSPTSPVSMILDAYASQPRPVTLSQSSSSSAHSSVYGSPESGSSRCSSFSDSDSTTSSSSYTSVSDSFPPPSSPSPVAVSLSVAPVASTFSSSVPTTIPNTTSSATAPSTISTSTISTATTTPFLPAPTPTAQTPTPHAPHHLLRTGAPPRQRARRGSTARAPLTPFRAALSPTPSPAPAQTQPYVRSTSTVAGTPPNATSSPRISASASVPPAPRRLPALRRRSVVDDRDLAGVGGVVERPRSPVMNQRRVREVVRPSSPLPGQTPSTKTKEVVEDPRRIRLRRRRTPPPRTRSPRVRCRIRLASWRRRLSRPSPLLRRCSCLSSRIPNRTRTLRLRYTARARARARPSRDARASRAPSCASWYRCTGRSWAGSREGIGGSRRSSPLLRLLPLPRPPRRAPAAAAQIRSRSGSRWSRRRNPRSVERPSPPPRRRRMGMGMTTTTWSWCAPPRRPRPSAAPCWAGGMCTRPCAHLLRVPHPLRALPRHVPGPSETGQTGQTGKESARRGKGSARTWTCRTRCSRSGCARSCARRACRRRSSTSCSTRTLKLRLRLPSPTRTAIWMTMGMRRMGGWGIWSCRPACRWRTWTAARRVGARWWVCLMKI